MKTDNQQKAGAIIVAAGESRRMGKVDKMFAPLGGKPILARVVDVFEACHSIHQVVVVVNEQNRRQDFTAQRYRAYTGEYFKRGNWGGAGEG